MFSAGKYLLQITAAGIFSSMINKLFVSKGTIGAAVRLLSGIFMILVVVSPLLDVRLDSVFDYLDDLKFEGATVATEGENNAKAAMADIITGQTQAYILDKAKTLGAELVVTVKVTDALPPVPCEVEILGDISPYARRDLSEYIQTQLGVGAEAQKWIG